MNRVLTATAFFLFCSVSLVADEETADLAKLSEAMGHLIGKNLHSSGIPIDVDALVRGMKKGCNEEGCSLSEDECLQAIADLQEKALSIESEKNLSQANEFLKNNQKQKNIVSIENNKLQYQILKAGSGNAVQKYNSPLVRYQGHYLNGQSFGSSEGDEMVALDDTIEGFSKGIVGMKEGERRVIYVHPDLGYGPHSLSMPNALLVFEVELIKADVSMQAQEANNSEDSLRDAETSIQ